MTWLSVAMGLAAKKHRPLGHTGYVAVAWCVWLALLGFVWARAMFNRDPTR